MFAVFGWCQEMINKYVILLIFSVFISSYSQIILKISANKEYKSRLYEYLNPYVISAYLIFFASTIITVLSYKGIELKYGAVIQSIGYIFVLILNKIILKQKITKNKVYGIVMIIIGIFIFTGY